MDKGARQVIYIYVCKNGCLYTYLHLSTSARYSLKCFSQCNILKWYLVIMWKEMENKQAVSLAVLMAFQFIHTCFLVFHCMLNCDITDDLYIYNTWDDIFQNCSNYQLNKTSTQLFHRQCTASYFALCYIWLCNFAHVHQRWLLCATFPF